MRQKIARVGQREGRPLSQIKRVLFPSGRGLSSQRPLYSYFKKGFRKKWHMIIPKGNMGYDQYTVPDTVAVEYSSDASL